MASINIPANIGGSGERAPGDCVIRVDGNEITGLYPYLTQVAAQISRHPAATATLSFETVRDAKGMWAVQDAGILAPWKSIVIEVAFGNDTEEVFRGMIRTVTADYPRQAGGATVTVACQDDSIRLDRTHNRACWGVDTPVTDQTILSQILASTPLTPDPGCGNGKSGLVLNQDSTDIIFLQSRADANGYELIFSEGQVYFGPMRVSGTPQPTVMVYAGPDTNCLSFRVTSDGHQPEAVAFDAAPAAGTAVVSGTVTSDLPLMGSTAATSDSSLGDFTWRLTRQGSSDPDMLTRLAQRRANEAAMRVRAEGELDGTLYGHVLRPGHPVGVDGIGDWLGGIYYVDRVSHRFDTSGYIQSFKLMRNAYGDNLPSGGGDPLEGSF